MKTIAPIIATLLCLLTIGGSSAVVLKPVECMLLVEQVDRFYMDWKTAQYVDSVIQERQRGMR